MTKAEHIAEAERLLAAAKDIMRKSTGTDDKASNTAFLNLLAIADSHSLIAQAMNEAAVPI